MISKVAVVLALVAVVVAQKQGYGHPKAAVHGQSYKENSYEEPKPYEFSYNIKDDYNGENHRQESGDGYGNVKGTYGYTDGYGIYRQVEYTADDYGFKANIKTNEPGTDNQNSADVAIYAEPAKVGYESKKIGYGKTVAHSGSYQAPVYGHGSSYSAPAHKTAHVSTHSRGYDNHGNGYGHASHVATHQTGYGNANTGYGHQTSYAVPKYNTAHVSTHRRGYNNNRNGYGHASQVNTYQTGYGHVNTGYGHQNLYATPLVHKASHVSTHQRGYDNHGNGYGHASQVVSHKALSHH